MTRRKIAGYVVMDTSDDGMIEQGLVLDGYEGYPPGGLLDWRSEVSKGARIAIFATRSEAREAIERTHHYAKAWGHKGYPDRKFCKIVPVEMIEDPADG